MKSPKMFYDCDVELIDGNCDSILILYPNGLVERLDLDVASSSWYESYFSRKTYQAAIKELAKFQLYFIGEIK